MAKFTDCLNREWEVRITLGMLPKLRAAGLVTLTEEGGLSYYSLRRERLDDASSELKRYLA